jgi:hypothetical protein
VLGNQYPIIDRKRRFSFQSRKQDSVLGNGGDVKVLLHMAYISTFGKPILMTHSNRLIIASGHCIHQLKVFICQGSSVLANLPGKMTPLYLRQNLILSSRHNKITFSRSGLIEP